MMNEDSTLKERIHPGYPYTKAEVVWAVRNEMAMQVEDILARRSRMLFVNARAASASAKIVAQLMAELLHYDHQWVELQVASFQELAAGYYTS
jgi:glycerol-3-phosphate dehydrogenase